MLVGPSGCGKSTLLRMLAGLEEVTAGAIRIDGKDVTDLAPRHRDIAMVFQSYALYPHKTVAENIAYPLRLRRSSRPERDERVRKVAELLDIGALLDRRPRQLSGGQRQRVALARAIIRHPQAFLMDEPLSNLDANLREEMRFEVRRLHDEYRYTTVYVTHDQSEAMTTADVIAVMNAGRIEQAGSPEDIYDRPRSEFVARFIGSSNVIRGKALDESHLSFADTVLRCTGTKLAAGADGAVSVRQHVIRLSPGAPQSMDNVVPATVVRQVFLGDSRDYMVAAADGTQLRVVTSPAENVPQGSPVWLYLPPERCRVLSG